MACVSCGEEVSSSWRFPAAPVRDHLSVRRRGFTPSSFCWWRHHVLLLSVSSAMLATSAHVEPSHSSLFQESRRRCPSHIKHCQFHRSGMLCLSLTETRCLAVMNWLSLSVCSVLSAPQETSRIFIFIIMKLIKLRENTLFLPVEGG